MTKEQDEDELRFRRYLARENLASLMNDTKWRELIVAIQGVERYRPHFRVKCVRDVEPAPDSWDGSFPSHVPTFCEIEWLEFDPVVRTRRGTIAVDAIEDFGNQIEAALAEAGISSQRIDGAIRVVGYVRPKSL